eukprot:m.255238 g.255238  ORF g.255238 m.255238 type:complete len:204 (-) comp19257_c0_seq1:147-758(-)
MDSSTEGDRSLRDSTHIGGFHESKLPFASEAGPVLKHLDHDHFAVITINTDTHELVVEQVGTCTCNAANIQEQLNKEEPRFYIFNFKKALFVYSCPDHAPRNLRMLYSTAKANTIAELKKFGLKPSVTLEISDVDDVDEYNIVGKDRPAASKSEAKSKTGGPTKAVPSQMSGSLSEFMAKSLGKSAMSGGKKRVVLPPNGAYG